MLMPYGRSRATRQAGEPLRDCRLGLAASPGAMHGGWS